VSLFLDPSLSLLARGFRELEARGEPLVLATVIETEGSTYRKPGARMLITRAGEIRGLLSGGCLEHDLMELSRRVVDDGVARPIDYDLRGADDLVFGFGAGCEGAMRILLQRVGPAEGWEPLRWLADRVEREERGTLATIIDSDDPALPVGACFWQGGRTLAASEPAGVEALWRSSSDNRGRPAVVPLGEARVFVSPIAPPPHLLLMGAGPDAEPLAELALRLGFRVTLVDHRPAYADPARFPGSRVVCSDADRVAEAVDLASFDATVVMSHYLPADAHYLRALSAAGPAYVGLLGPTARRKRLLEEIGGQAAAGLRGRLHGPVGLDIGARSPEAIALAIVAEIHAVLAGAPGVSSGR